MEAPSTAPGAAANAKTTRPVSYDPRTDPIARVDANPEQNIIWSPESFRRPVSIVAPRTLRLGAKLEW